MNPAAPRMAGWIDYVVNLNDNLLSGVNPELFTADFAKGAGKELQWNVRFGNQEPPKMHAAHSSAALVVNTFGPWKQDPSLLILAGHTGFDTIRFEAKCPTGLSGLPPHLDVLGSLRKPRRVGVESKCTEFLSGHKTKFAPSYDSLTRLSSAKAYFDLIGPLRSSPGEYKHLDAPQLIKHALGLATCFPSESVTLLYLFWEPLNWERFIEFKSHREEIHKFANAVSGSPIQFMWMSYPELWATWASTTNEQPRWLNAHITALKERYEFNLPKTV
jgi:hypothetical protein